MVMIHTPRTPRSGWIIEPAGGGGGGRGGRESKHCNLVNPTLPNGRGARYVTSDLQSSESNAALMLRPLAPSFPAGLGCWHHG